MANWDRQLVGSAPQVMLRVELWEESVDYANNRSWVRYRLSFLTSNGSRSGTWDYWLNVNGGRVATNSFGGTHSGWQTVVDSGYWHGRDANGNGSASAQGWGDVFYGSGDTGGSIGLTRIGRAPNIVGNTADQITDTSVRLGTEIGDYGNGTSAAARMYYKTPEASGWTQTSDQNDVAGYNYWTITGLVSNQKYYRLARWWNNNGDTSDLPNPYPNESYVFVTLANATSSISNILATTATINAVPKQGHYATNTKVQYRKAGDTAWIDTSEQLGASPSFNLSGLLPNTTYEYRLAVRTTAGTWNQAVQTFTTLPAGKLIYPNGDVKNAIPRLVYPNGDVDMININLVD